MVEVGDIKCEIPPMVMELWEAENAEVNKGKGAGEFGQVESHARELRRKGCRRGSE